MSQGEVGMILHSTWLIRFSQPIRLRPAAARMMAAKSSFSSSFFRRVFRLPRWETTAQENTERQLLRPLSAKYSTRAAPSHPYFNNTHIMTDDMSLKGYDIFEFQVGEPLLQLSSTTQRTGADHATQFHRGLTEFRFR